MNPDQHRHACFQVLIALDFGALTKVLSEIDPDIISNLCGSSVPEQHAIWRQLPLNQSAVNHPGSPQGCNCTQGHAYRVCYRFKEHYWTWLGEGTANGDFCSCPPTDEALLSLECTRLEEHIQVCPPVQCGPPTDYHL